MYKIHLDSLQDTQKEEEFISRLSLQEGIDICISFPAIFSSSKTLRDIIDKVCQKIDVLPLWRTRLILIADELNNNSIEHGSEPWDENEFVFRVIVEDQDTLSLFLQVTDTGNSPGNKTAKEMEELRQASQKKDYKQHTSIRWRGLFLIISDLVDELSFDDTAMWGLQVGVSLHIPRYPSKS